MSSSGDGEAKREEPSAALEVERKFRVHGLYRLPAITLADGGRSESPHQAELTATYFDTEDLRLARSKVTLRRREGGPDEGWHLKLPVGDETREELAVPLDHGDVLHPPAELTDLVLALTRSSSLEIVATLRTERTTYPIVSATGDVVASLTDDSVSVLDADRVVARFRELEVEAVGGSPNDQLAALDQVGACLEAVGAVRGGSLSKVGRALGPLASGEPDVLAPGPVSPADPAELALRAHLARHTLTLMRHDLGVRRDAEDSVHQMRVAARRLRSGLKVFEPLLDEARTRPVREELAWLAGVLGEVRDREVLRARILADLDGLKADPHAGVDAGTDLTAIRRLIRTSFTTGMSGAQ